MFHLPNLNIKYALHGFIVNSKLQNNKKYSDVIVTETNSLTTRVLLTSIFHRMEFSSNAIPPSSSYLLNMLLNTMYSTIPAKIYE